LSETELGLPAEIDPNEDRYPKIQDVLAAVAAADELPETGVDRVEVHCFASGEATYRVWAARAEEPHVGYFPTVS
jgi:hypothetical protein